MNHILIEDCDSVDSFIDETIPECSAFNLMRLWLHEYPLSLSIQIWGHNVAMNSLVGSQMSPDLIEIKKTDSYTVKATCLSRVHQTH